MEEKVKYIEEIEKKSHENSQLTEETKKELE